MSAPARIALVTEGAVTPDGSWSGSAYRVASALRSLGHDVVAVDADLYARDRLLAAARTFSLDQARWKSQFHFGAVPFDLRSARAAAGLGAVSGTIDVILQIGATFRPPGPGIPYVVYCDFNMASSLRRRESPFSAARRLSPVMAAEMNEREATVYRGATTVFAMSEHLRQSFIDDYGLKAERVLTASPGPNFNVADFPARPDRRADGQPPTVLFIGKDFLRKGGDVLLDAFARLRQRVPDARLRVIGPEGLPAAPGVEMMGTLRKAVPEQYARLQEALTTADVFCLPTRYEPFGIAVVEAMALGLACVTSDTWAMTEMVVPGETGLIAPDGDAVALAEALERLLRDTAMARRMGEAGRRRQLEKFTWPNAAAVLHRRIQEISDGSVRGPSG